jgi:hypothetical protein
MSRQKGCGARLNMVTANTSQLSAMSRLFSAAVFREMAKRGRSATFARLFKMAKLRAASSDRLSVGDGFDLALAVLKKSGHRDEYVYRAALTKNILMGKHSLRTSSMLNEFRVGACRADLVILNGTASVYEIKSERDSLGRLLNQVQSYKRVFATVNVIVSDNHVESVRRIVPDDVGIMRLSQRHHISVEREAVACPERVCPITVFESLRSSEATAILEALGFTGPTVPNTQRRGVLRELFADLDPVALHREMVRTLKRTRNLAPLSELVDQLPTSLHAAALSVPVLRSDHVRLIDAVTVSLDEAMAWA